MSGMPDEVVRLNLWPCSNENQGDPEPKQAET